MAARKLFLAACSDPVFPWADGKLPALEAAAKAAGYELISGPARELPLDPTRVDPAARARLFEEGYRRADVDAVVDISGGTLAIEMLPHVDWELVGANPKPYVGLSDLTCPISALAAVCGRGSLYWNPLAGVARGFAGLDAALAGRRVVPEEVPGEFRDAKFSGGNLSKLLGLSGTRWWPPTAGSVLFVEGLRTSVRSFAAGLAHLQELGVLREVRALTLGQFTEIDAAAQRPLILEIAREYARGLPLFEIPSVGHSKDTAPLSLY